jgi:hypothetical protein
MTIHRPIVQIAYIVPEVRAAAQRWAGRVGAGPFFVFDHFELTATHDGKPAVLDHSPAFGQWGDVQVELIQLHELEPAPFREAFGGGKIGLHHLTWFPDDLDAEGARLGCRARRRRRCGPGPSTSGRRASARTPRSRRRAPG